MVRLGSHQPRHDTLAYHCTLELSEHAHHLKESSSCWRRGVDGPPMEIQPNFEGMNLGKETKQVF
jgi:hypothetical protein